MTLDVDALPTQLTLAEMASFTLSPLSTGTVAVRLVTSRLVGIST